ncbi:MAG: hypothetical protein WCG87_12465 [Bacteroidota bacterium]
MKKILLPIVAILLLLVGCDKLKKLASFTYEANLSSVQTIPAQSSFTPTFPVTKDFATSTVSTNVAQYNTQYNTAVNLIDSVVMSKLSVVKIGGTSAVHFNFIDTIRVYAKTNSQSEVLVAYMYGIPTNSDSLALTCADVNLKPYFTSDSISMRVNAHFLSLPDSGGTVRINTALTVYANPLN